MTNTNILITGATGFIGKVLTKKLLDLNYNIVALSRNFNGKSGYKNLIYLKSDLNDFENIKEDIIPSDTSRKKKSWFFISYDFDYGYT